eukprot:ctg_7275.g675
MSSSMAGGTPEVAYPYRQDITTGNNACQKYLMSPPLNLHNCFFLQGYGIGQQYRLRCDQT